MDSQNLLYKSKGIPAKARSVYQITLAFLGVVGIILLLLPLFTDAPSIFTLFGILYLALCFLFPRTYYTACSSRLFVYEDHIAGIAISCIEQNSQTLFPDLKQIKNMNNTDRCKFSLSYRDVTDIQTLNMFLPQIVIMCGDIKYQIAVKDLDKAYQLLCDKVYGDMAARKCANCDREISAITESCPHCGHLTRYGKQQKDSSKIRSNNNKMQMQFIIGAVIFIIGLIIMVPAIIDLNEISSYAGLYASIYPSRAKKLVARFILGLFVTIFGLCTPITRLLINKINPRQD